MGSTQKLLGAVSGAVGGAGLIVGGIFGGLTISEASTVNGSCGPGAKNCSSMNYGAATGAHSSGVTDGAVSTVGFVAGGILVAAGAVLFFKAPSSRSSSSTGMLLAPSVGPGSRGLLLTGEF